MISFADISAPFKFILLLLGYLELVSIFFIISGSSLKLTLEHDRFFNFELTDDAYLPISHTQNNFMTCSVCERIYWQETHWVNTNEEMDRFGIEII